MNRNITILTIIFIHLTFFHIKMMNIASFNEDLLELEGFARRLEKFIQTEQDFVEGSLVISLSSKYGSGKTTFLNMWRSAIKNAGEGEYKPLVISLNAWESDYNSDPLFAIISALVSSIQEKDGEVESLIEAAKNIGWFSTTIAVQVMKHFSGIDPLEAGQVAIEKSEKRNKKQGADAFTLYEGRKKAMDALKQAIKGVVDSSPQGTLFLVDELDRCRPDYAISYLETIKHIFDMKGAVFILAADRKQLENSARTAFGIQLDFEEYYRKFVHREASLPSISSDGYRRLANQYVRYYLEREGSRFCYMKLDGHRIDNICELVGALKLTPRQIQEIFRTLGHLLETTEEDKGKILWCIAVGSIAMSVFKVGAPDIYEALGKQQLTPDDAIIFLRKTLTDINTTGWMFTLFLTGNGLSVESAENHEKTLKDFSEKFHFRSNPIDSWYRDWNGMGYRNDTSRFKQIYKNIQEISQWK